MLHCFPHEERRRGINFHHFWIDAFSCSFRRGIDFENDFDIFLVITPVVFRTVPNISIFVWWWGYRDSLLRIAQKCVTILYNIVHRVDMLNFDSTGIPWAFEIGCRITQICALSELSLCAHNPDHLSYNYFSISVQFFVWAQFTCWSGHFLYKEDITKFRKAWSLPAITQLCQQFETQPRRKLRHEPSLALHPGSQLLPTLVWLLVPSTSTSIALALHFSLHSPTSHLPPPLLLLLLLLGSPSEIQEFSLS